MNETALSMDEARRKLAKLEELIPNAPNELLYDFGRHLAGYLNLELVPMGFVLRCELALYDLQTGVNGFTGEPIQRSQLVGCPPIIYALLRMEIPRIADAVLPAEFAASVKSYIEQVNAEMKTAERATK
jgi:hypothetical protein